MLEIDLAQDTIFFGAKPTCRITEGSLCAGQMAAHFCESSSLFSAEGLILKSLRSRLRIMKIMPAKVVLIN
jgi:hypothetical protein